MNRRGFTFIELVSVWAIIAILAAILFPVFARAREKAYQTNCLNNLVNIGVALRIYAQDNYGHFPPENNNLWPLVPNYLPDSATFICPTAERRRTQGPARPPQPPAYGSPIDYVYWGGWCDDDKPKTVIAGEDEGDRHNDGANYLFLDGHVKWMSSRAVSDPELRALSGLTGLQEIGQLQKPLPPPPPSPPDWPPGVPMPPGMMAPPGGPGPPGPPPPPGGPR